MEHQDYTRLYTKYKSKYTKAKYGQSGGGYNVDFIVREVGKKNESTEVIAELKRSISSNYILSNPRGLIELFREQIGNDVGGNVVHLVQLVDYMHLIELMVKNGFIDVSESGAIRGATLNSVGISIDGSHPNITDFTIMIDKKRINKHKNMTVEIVAFTEGNKIQEILDGLKNYIDEHRKSTIYARFQKKNPIDGEITGLTKPIRFNFDIKTDILQIYETLLRGFLDEYIEPEKCNLFCKITGKKYGVKPNELFDDKTIRDIMDKKKENSTITDYIIDSCCGFSKEQTGAMIGLRSVVTLAYKYVYDSCESDLSTREPEEFTSSFVCQEILGNELSWIKIPPKVVDLSILDEKFKDMFRKTVKEVIIWNVHIDLEKLRKYVKKLQTPPTSN